MGRTFAGRCFISGDMAGSPTARNGRQAAGGTASTERRHQIPLREFSARPQDTCWSAAGVAGRLRLLSAGDPVSSPQSASPLQNALSERRRGEGVARGTLFFSSKETIRPISISTVMWSLVDGVCLCEFVMHAAIKYSFFVFFLIAFLSAHSSVKE